MSRLTFRRDCFRLEGGLKLRKLENYNEEKFEEECLLASILSSSKSYEIFWNDPKQGENSIVMGDAALEIIKRVVGSLFIPHVLARCSIRYYES